MHPHTPDTASCPGEAIRAAMEERGVDPAELAHRLGVTLPDLVRLISGEVRLTRWTAYALEAILGVPATYWIASEAAYRRRP